MTQTTRHIMMFLLFFLSEQGIAEQQRQSIESIQQAVVNFLTSKIQLEHGDFEIKVSPLDSRLRLAPCSRELEVFMQSGGIRNGSASVGVRCHGDKPWTIFTRAIIKRFENIVVLARPVERGTVITAADLSMEVHQVSRIHGSYFTSLDQAINKQAKRPLLAGAVLLSSAVDEVKLVKKGQHVTIIAKSDAIDIRMTGKALMNGSAGQRVRVRNDKSKRIIEGIVAAPGLVQVTF
ncbi:MAG: flagellar basal body P-ring formation chaperone FlgA [Pseudomonadota bacterium]